LQTIPTTCIYCGCGCGLMLHVEEGRVVAASPQINHPLSQGHLCLKGWLAYQFLDHPDRLRRPMIRKGERLVPSSWDQALDLARDELSTLLRESGPASLGVLTSAKASNEENFLLMKLARAGLKTNNVDHVARLCHAPTLAALSSALGSGSMTNPIVSLRKSDMILVAGSNTTEQHPLVAFHILQARKTGAEIVVVDPRRTAMARLADLHLAPLPGTDAAWINGLLRAILDLGLEDRQFIEARTEGFEEARAALDPYTPQMVEQVTNIPADDLVLAASKLGSANRAAFVYAMGITQHYWGTDNVQALANLALATGNVGRDGTGIYPLRGHQNVQGACDMGALPAYYSGYQPVSSSRSRFERAWKTDLPAEIGLTAVEMMDAAQAGRIKGMIISGENPMLSFPDQTQVRAALEELDFLLVVDIFPTETARLANVVLPAASFAEKEGTFTSTERRVQLARGAVSPPGEAWPEWRIWADLLTRFEVDCLYESAAQIMEEIASLTPSYGGISHSRLGTGGLVWPCPNHDHPGTPILHVDSFPIGRARFRPVEYKAPSEKPDEEYPFLLTTGRSLFQFHTGTMTRRVPLLEREVPEPFLDISPPDARQLGLKDGTYISVESRRGRLIARARVTPDVNPGHLFLPIHFLEGPANLLTSRYRDPISGMPALKEAAVRLRRL